MGLLSLNNKILLLNGTAINLSLPDPEIYISPSAITNVSYTGKTYSISVCGNVGNSTTVADACTWIVTTSPVSPSVSGTINNIQVCENLTSSCRSAVVCYEPSFGGTMKCVTVCQSTGDTNIYVTPASQTDVASAGATVTERVCGLTSNSTAVSVGAYSWLSVSSPVSPSATPGTSHNIVVSANSGAARTGYVCYTPTVGAMRTITVSQLKSDPPIEVELCKTYNDPLNGGGYEACVCGCLCLSSNPGCCCYTACINWHMELNNEAGVSNAYWCLYCNNTCINGCTINGYTCNCNGSFSRDFDYNDTVCFRLYSSMYPDYIGAITSMSLTNITSCQLSPCYCLGSSAFIEAYTIYSP